MKKYHSSYTNLISKPLGIIFSLRQDTYNIDCIIYNCSNDDTRFSKEHIKQQVTSYNTLSKEPPVPIDNWKYLISYIDNEYANIF